MNKKLKIALIGCCSDKGFALPIAVGLGLIMLLIGATMIMRSQGDQVTASAQKATNRGLSAAETGITRYQSLINSNRVIATYNRTAPSGSPSWVNASAIPGITNTCSGNNGANAVASAATTDWQDVDPPVSATGYAGDPIKGQYKLVNYVYQPDSVAATTPGVGTLTVEGRVNQVGSGNTANAQVGTATTRLQVNIRVVKQPLTGSIPGLWLQNTPQNLSSNMVKGNILVAGCTLPSGVSQSNVTSGNTVTASPYATIPDTPALPDLTKLNTITALTMDDRIWGETLPKVGDINSDGTAYAAGVSLLPSSPTYSYLIDGNLARNGGADIALRSNAKIILYVRGNIDLGGGPNINVSGNASNMQIYGNTFLRNSDSTIKVDPTTNRLLTKYGCSILLPIISSPTSSLEPPSYTGACPTTSVAVNGNASVHALIHAVDAVGAVSGGGGHCNAATNTGFIGALWLKKWDAASNNSNQLVCAEGDYGSFLATQNNAPPSISSITGWQRQEIP